ncbi:MAG: hypothetical protein AB7O96_05910 [Pseudobdellovibrionaceae bacterium]
MKIQLAALMLTLSVPFFSQAEEVCAFGSGSYDLREELDSEADKKEWYAGEHLSVGSEVRLKGLTSTEKRMILISQDAAFENKAKQAEVLKDFASNEGYIRYFSANSSDREFVMVGSFPGDNEFGVILEIKRLQRNTDYKILSTVAVISDGDFEECKVLKGAN